MTVEPIAEQSSGSVTVSFGDEIDFRRFETFRDQIIAAAGPGVGSVIVDLSAVTFIDSTGIRGLLEARKALEEQGVELRLGNLSRPVARLFDVTGLFDYIGNGVGVVVHAELQQIVVVTGEGEIDQASYEAFRESIIASAAGDTTCVVVDMGAVTFLDSTGLRGLIGARKRLDELGVDMRLGPLSTAAERVLDVTGILAAFDRYDA